MPPSPRSQDIYGTLPGVLFKIYVPTTGNCKLVTYLGSLGVVKIANYVMLPKESRQVELMDVSVAFPIVLYKISKAAIGSWQG